MATIPESQQKIAASVVKYLQDKGITLEGACGIAGNIKGESQFNSAAYNPNDNGGPSGGICQWHNNRFINLVNYAKKYNKNWKTDIGIQLDFLMSELNGSYKKVFQKIIVLPIQL